MPPRPAARRSPRSPATTAGASPKPERPITAKSSGACGCWPPGQPGCGGVTSVRRPASLSTVIQCPLAMGWVGCRFPCRTDDVLVGDQLAWPAFTDQAGLANLAAVTSTVALPIAPNPVSATSCASLLCWRFGRLSRFRLHRSRQDSSCAGRIWVGVSLHRTQGDTHRTDKYLAERRARQRVRMRARRLVPCGGPRRASSGHLVATPLCAVLSPTASSSAW
jgi:hypothetical protein